MSIGTPNKTRILQPRTNELATGEQATKNITSVEKVLNSRCSSDFDGNPKENHWGNFRARVYKFLNRQGYRIILGLLASIYITFKTKRYVRIFYDGAWIHKHFDGVIVDRGIRLEHSISKIISTTYDYCFHIYKPELGDIIFDIGAGIGDETFVFSKEVGQNGTIVSIEAHQRLSYA